MRRSSQTVKSRVAVKSAMGSSKGLHFPLYSPVGAPRKARGWNKEVDLPITGLIQDLKQRNLLDSTLIVWMGEFGRTPDRLADLRD